MSSGGCYGKDCYCWDGDGECDLVGDWEQATSLYKYWED